jgi:hypothetical protein
LRSLRTVSTSACHASITRPKAASSTAVSLTTLEALVPRIFQATARAFSSVERSARPARSTRIALCYVLWPTEEMLRAVADSAGVTEVCTIRSESTFPTAATAQPCGFR